MKTSLFAVAALALAFTAQPVFSQAAAAYSDEELRSFAMAATKVQRINDVYLPKLREAKTEDEQQQVQETATTEMRRALDEEGVTVDKFRDIVEQAQADPALAERIREQFRRAQQGRPR